MISVSTETDTDKCRQKPTMTCKQNTNRPTDETEMRKSGINTDTRTEKIERDKSRHEDGTAFNA